MGWSLLPIFAACARTAVPLTIGVVAEIENDLDAALLLAIRAHAGQADKAGQPYILHCLRVMLLLGHAAPEEQRVVAVLHDVIEDTHLDLETLAMRFGPAVAAAVDALSRRTGESYARYLDRVRENSLAAAVKMADLRDNLDESRASTAMLPRSIVARYKKAEAYLRWHCPPSCTVTVLTAPGRITTGSVGRTKESC